eukprot:s7930_g1.t2
MRCRGSSRWIDLIDEASLPGLRLLPEVMIGQGREKPASSSKGTSLMSNASSTCPRRGRHGKGKRAGKHDWASWKWQEWWSCADSSGEWMGQASTSWTHGKRHTSQWGRPKCGNSGPMREHEEESEMRWHSGSKNRGRGKQGGTGKSPVPHYEAVIKVEEGSEKSSGSADAPQAANSRWRRNGKADGKGSEGTGKGKSTRDETAEPKPKRTWKPVVKSPH